MLFNLFHDDIIYKIAIQLEDINLVYKFSRICITVYKIVNLIDYKNKKIKVRTTHSKYDELVYKNFDVVLDLSSPLLYNSINNSVYEPYTALDKFNLYGIKIVNPCFPVPYHKVLNLNNLRILFLDDADITDDEFQYLINLTEIHLYNCYNVEYIKNLPKLKCLKVLWCSKLKTIENINNCDKLNITFCCSYNFDNLYLLKNIKELSINITNIITTKGLENGKIEILNLSNNNLLCDISHVSYVKKINIYQCSKLV